jgi:hypothetical protein
MFPLVIRALLTGGTLVVDEFDASIHPMALMSIINIFHNDEINKKHAQLIFNTHNPIFLNSNLFRRDEIKFVERDEETHKSILYSLSDFGTAGKDGVRKNEDYMKNYFISRYGAIRNIDLTPIFEEEPQAEHAEAAYNDTPETYNLGIYITSALRAKRNKWYLEWLKDTINGTQSSIRL